MPDRLLVKPSGQVIFIEFKRPGLFPTNIQRVWLFRLLHLTHRTAVVRTFDEFRALVDSRSVRA